jgi:phenylacetate-CoA ligase
VGFRGDDLAQLPLLSPSELAVAAPPRSQRFLFADERPGLVLKSSGTAAIAKVIYHSWPFTRRVELLGARGVRAALPDTPRRIANCTMVGELNGTFLFVHEIGRLLDALVLPVTCSSSIERTATIIAEHGVDTVVAGPAYLCELVTRVDPSRLATLRNLLYSGEAMGAERLAMVPHRRLRLPTRAAMRVR